MENVSCGEIEMPTAEALLSLRSIASNLRRKVLDYLEGMGGYVIWTSLFCRNLIEDGIASFFRFFNHYLKAFNQKVGCDLHLVT